VCIDGRFYHKVGFRQGAHFSPGAEIDAFQPMCCTSAHNPNPRKLKASAFLA
jgi:hypothetical protein